MISGAMLLKCIRVIGLFFDPRKFWMIYLGYTFFFLNGLIGGSVIDPEFVNLSDLGLFGFILDLSLSSSLALLCIFLAGYLGFKRYQAKDFLAWFYLTHCILLIYYAVPLAELGFMVKWSSR